MSFWNTHEQHSRTLHSRKHRWLLNVQGYLIMQVRVIYGRHSITDIFLTIQERAQIWQTRQWSSLGHDWQEFEHNSKHWVEKRWRDAGLNRANRHKQIITGRKNPFIDCENHNKCTGDVDKQWTVNDSMLATSTDDVMRGVCEYGGKFLPIPPAINQDHRSSVFRDLTSQLRGVGFW